MGVVRGSYGILPLTLARIRLCRSERIGGVAQLGERLVRNQKVEGSIPFASITGPTGKARSGPFVRGEILLSSPDHPHRVDPI
jgi:hypothetical protein